MSVLLHIWSSTTKKAEKLTVAEFLSRNWSNHEDVFMTEMITGGHKYIDRIFLDYDGEDYIEAMTKIETVLAKEDAERSYVFTGRGLHVYIHCEPVIIKNIDIPSYIDFINIIEEMTGIQFDPHIKTSPGVGRRIVGCLNSKTKKLSTYIDLSGKPVEKYTYGSKKVKIIAMQGLTKMKGTPVIKSKIDFVPPCVKTAQSQMGILESSHSERLVYITYMYQFGGKTKKDIFIDLTNFLPTNKLRHSVFEENNIETLQKYSFPSCLKIKEWGLCTPCPFEKMRKLITFNGKVE